MLNPLKKRLQRTCSLLFAVLLTCDANAGGPITALAFNSLGTRVVTAQSREIHVLNWSRDKVEQRIHVDIDHIHDLHFLPGDSQRLLVVGGSPSEFGVIAIVDLGRAEVITSRHHGTDVIMAAACGSDHRIVTGGMSNELTSWDIATVAHGNQHDAVIINQFPTPFPAGHSKPVLCVTYTDDLQEIVSAGVDHTLRVWSAADQRLISRLDHHTGSVRALASRPGSEKLPMIASTSADHTVRFWQPSRGRMVRFARFRDEPTVAAWTRDGNWLVVGFTNGYVRVIDPETAAVAAESQVCQEWIYAIDTSPATNWEFVVAGQDIYPVKSRWEPFVKSEAIE